MKKTLLLSILISIFANFLHAEPLWGKAEAGASSSAIANLYPEGKTVEPSTGDKLKSGASLMYRLEGVPVVDERFRVDFYFLNDKLEQVTLASTTMGKTPLSCDHTAKAVIEGLRSKYGDPLKHETSELSWDFSWSPGKTSVSLCASNLAATRSCSIYVLYNQRIAESASNL